MGRMTPILQVIQLIPKVNVEVWGRIVEED